MFVWMCHQPCSIVTLMLGITFVTITYDLGRSRMGVQAWTYNYTDGPAMDWESARKYCQEHFTDMVAIQNQEEIRYLNDMLPYVKGYYWIGIRKVAEKWTWVGTKKELTEEAANWADNEPSGGKTGEDCVEIYIKRPKDTTKWNDEKCNKKKQTICYTASCSEDSCSEFGECVETIGNFTCKCLPGFEGPRCENAVACRPLLDPEQGTLNCVDVFEKNRFNSSCQVECNPGYRLQGAAQIRCLASAQWTHPSPSCTAVKCPEVSAAPSGGSVNCSHPTAPHSFTSTCEFSCDEGFVLQGAHRIQCDPTGQWTDSEPTCTAVECPEVSAALSKGSVNCSHPIAPHSFTSTCEFSCDEGFVLQGAHRIQCGPTGQWTDSQPTCTAVECPELSDAPSGGSVNCSHPIAPHSFTSTCEFSCDEGFMLQGAHRIQCGPTGQWTHPEPTCKALECPELSDAPSGGSVNCSHPIDPHSFTSTCEFSCDEGFVLQGAHRIQCGPTGQWTHPAPTCTEREVPLWAAMLKYTAIGAGSATGLLGMIGAILLIKRMTKKLRHYLRYSVGTDRTRETNIARFTKTAASQMLPYHKMFIWMHHQHFPMVMLMLEITFFTNSYDLGQSRAGVQAWTYNYTDGPAMDWASARKYCQEHFTDMVAIQNQEEIRYLNDMLPYVKGYYWIGIRKVSEKWTWVGTRKELTEEAANWAKGEPNGKRNGEDCVEIYIKRPKDNTKWNDEKCVNKKQAICYTASCSEDSCSEFAECVETIGNYRCKCLPGFEGSRCENAVACVPPLDPDQGTLSCVHVFGTNRFNSSCQVECNTGYRLQGAAQIRCLASAQWTHPSPSCTVVECPAEPDAPSGGSVNCSHPIAPHSFTSTCEFSCDEGFVLQGAHRIQCDPTGQWTHPEPTCKAVECPEVSAAPNGGSVNCSHPIAPHSFTSTCEFSCDEGFVLQGAHRIQCGPTGQWTDSQPTCTAVECPEVSAAPSGGSVNCSHPIAPHSFTSTCEFGCDEGFVLQGAHRIQCDPTGQWTDSQPTCKAVQCEELVAIPQGKLNCLDPLEKFSYSSTCWSECDSGYVLQGNNSTYCSAHGQWSNALPVCQVVECPEVSAALSGGSVNCSHPIAPHSFTSTCEFSCDEGFVLQGAHRIQCDPTGQWTDSEPTCTVVECPAEPNAPRGGIVNCRDPIAPHSFTSSCEFSCDEGFMLQGAHRIQCGPTGQWTHPAANCKVVECPAEPNAPSGGSVNCSHPIAPHSFTSTCEFSCDEGFVLQGAHRIQCGPTGQWTDSQPTCKALECPEVSSAPSGGSVNCSHPIAPHSFTSTCEFSCDEGFVLQGAHRIQCDPTGQWTDSQPTCTALECPEVSAAPSGGSVNCSHPIDPHSFTSTCEFSCDEGFMLQGAHRIQCGPTGQWTDSQPTCKAVECPEVSAAPSGGSVNCSHPIAPHSFTSTCEFSCDEGFVLQGAHRIQCDTTGQWTHPEPTCKAVECAGLIAIPLGKLNCLDPLEKFSYTSTCWSECDSGYVLQGSNSTYCSAHGQWTNALPVCQVVKCPEVSAAPSGGSVNCSHPIAPHSFTSTCEFSCDEGFVLQGAHRIQCGPTGQWTHPAANCTEREVPVGAAMLKYTAIGAGSAAGLLGIIAAILLIKRMTRKGKPEETLWNTGINPVSSTGVNPVFEADEC
ncbi:sushi, von Willebrand factor type A, EGF and pentraxin domain-containing protein 1-like [Engraulis encrasicolus]|uniref:sushi, von Willebrand factor type A, EGF and pentraxin domain-containing protein 1-like n=1 Tax=Engraulis encrasicolus TaxID=184585 RepID=UPI002FD0C6C7